MKTKQALIKLASLKLAINYVLRNRLTKQAGTISPLVGAGIGAGLGYLLNPYKDYRLWSALGGGLLGGVAGYKVDKAYNVYNEALNRAKGLQEQLDENTKTQADIYNSLSRLHNKFGLQNYGGKNALDLISDIQIQLDNVNTLNCPILSDAEKRCLNVLLGPDSEVRGIIRQQNDFLQQNNGKQYIILPALDSSPSYSVE